MLSLRATADSEPAIGNSSPYGYIPSLTPGIAYLVMFILLTLVHAGLAWRYKYLMVFVTLVPGGILEIVGWAGRIWSHFNVLNPRAFIMQICCLIIGPAFFSAWAYWTLGYCIQHLGPAYSLLQPRMYLAVFVAADIASLVLQAIGGGQAAVQYEEGFLTTQATHIACMLSGILFQLATMTIFVALATDFIVRAVCHRPYAFRQRQISAPKTESSTATEKPKPTKEPAPNVELFTSNWTPTPETGPPSDEIVPPYSNSISRKIQLFQFGVAFASLMIYIRGVYRSIELAQGWTGYVITHESFFTCLDGLPMTLCLAAFVLAHPGWLLPLRRTWHGA